MGAELYLDDVAATSPVAMKELAEMRDGIARLRAALEKYGRHLGSDCLPGECYCGWRAAIDVADWILP